MIDLMSAFGTKRTSANALHMSAFGGKAELEAAMSANDPSGHANRPINACFDVTRSASSALATPGEVYSEVAQASGDDETDPA